MFGLLDTISEDIKDRKARIKYSKEYPFNSSVDKENTANDHICVMDVDIGFNVYEHCKKIEMIKWFKNLDDAVEFAVDHARERILNYQD